MDIVWAGQSQLRLVVAHLLWQKNSQLIKSRAQLLHHIWPDLRLLVSALHLDGFQDSGSEGVVIDPPASPQSSCNDGGLGHQVHSAQVTHALPELPSVNGCPFFQTDVLHPRV